jgi:thioesterase domain-containing protein
MQDWSPSGEEHTVIVTEEETQMASARVEQMLEEIAHLSREEQAELLQRLPRVLRAGGPPRQLSMEAVQQAITARERIRARLHVAAQSPGSISADLDEVRNGRLDDLLRDGVTQDGAQ